MTVAGILQRYFARRLGLAMLGVFLTIGGLVYVLDFVELMRRAGDSPAASAVRMAQLAALRTPSVIERILPFAILFGAMIAFLNLSRRLELVVVRSAGVSVWQFLRPGLVLTLLAGFAATMLFNPLAATLKDRANTLEARIFPRSGGESDIFLRQRSETGYAVIHAGKQFEQGRRLTDVTFFVFGIDGRFRERVAAEEAELAGLQWRLARVRVAPADQPPFTQDQRTIATNLRPEFILRSFTPPDSVPFWRLRSEAALTESLGLDATRHYLQFQRLLAQPLLLVAMVIIASTVSLRFFRMGGVARSVLVGVAAGFVLYIVRKLVEDLGSVGLLGTIFAAWMPAVLGCVAGGTVLLHQEDG